MPNNNCGPSQGPMAGEIIGSKGEPTASVPFNEYIIKPAP